MTTTFTLSVELHQFTCGKCGGVYAITERYREEKARCGGNWNCPYCQCNWGYGEGEVGRLKKELEAVQVAARQAKCDALNNARLRVEAEDRAQKVEVKLARVRRGVCPCCKRTFQNLLDHMKTKHPNESKRNPSPVSKRK